MCPHRDEWPDPREAGGNIGVGEIAQFSGVCNSRGMSCAPLFGLLLVRKAFSGADILYLPPRIHYPCLGSEVER